MIVSVHVDILGISDGSIGLSYARGFGPKVEGVPYHVNIDRLESV